MAIGSARRTSAIATLWLAVRTFLAPKFYFVFFSALDASLTHLSVVFNLSIRELSVLPEYDVEAQTEYAESDQDKCCNENLHII